MDDLLVFGPDKQTLKTELTGITAFLEDELALTLKPVQLNRCAHGIPFLGYRIFPGRIRLAPRSRKRFIQKFKLYENRWQKGEWSEDDLARHMLPLVEFTKAADARSFRQTVIQRFGVSS